MDRKQNLMNFVPTLRSGEWSDIGGRPSMEDTYICIGDLAEKFGNNALSEEAISFYGVSYLIDYAILHVVINFILSHPQSCYICNNKWKKFERS